MSSSQVKSTPPRHPDLAIGCFTILFLDKESIMAQEWCIAYEVLPFEEASELHAQLLAYKKKGGVMTMTSPVKSSPVEPQTKKHKTGTGKKRKSDDAFWFANIRRGGYLDCSILINIYSCVQVR